MIVYRIWDKTTKSYTGNKKIYCNKPGALLGIRRLKEFAALKDHDFRVHRFELTFTGEEYDTLLVSG